jgi:hypothetical protein
LFGNLCKKQNKQNRNTGPKKRNQLKAIEQFIGVNIEKGNKKYTYRKTTLKSSGTTPLLFSSLHLPHIPQIMHRANIFGLEKQYITREESPNTQRIL